MLLPNQQPLTLFRRSYRMGLVLLSTALASVSCSKENTGQSEETAGRLEISVRPTTVQMTKASDTAFEDGDEFGLTVVQWLDSEPCDLSLIRYEDNVMFTVEEGSEPYAWPAAYYPDRSTPCSFYAYYPYNETGFRRGTNILPVQVATNQGYGISGSDYMVAVKDTVYPTEESVPLVFDHILAKIVLNLIAGDGCTTADLLTSDLTLKSFSTEAEYDIVEQTFSAISSRADIIPSTNWAESSDRITGSCAIVIPQKFRAGESMLYCTINNKILAYKPSSDILFESGRQYNFDITVTVTDLGPSIAVSSEITDWQEGDKMHIEVPTQWPQLIRVNVAQLLSLDASNVIVHQMPCNPLHNEYLICPAVLAYIAAMGTIRAGVPVVLSGNACSDSPLLSVERTTWCTEDGKPVYEECTMEAELGAFQIEDKEYIRQALAGLIPNYPLSYFNASVTTKRSASRPSLFYSGCGYADALFTSEAHLSRKAISTASGPAMRPSTTTIR